MLRELLRSAARPTPFQPSDAPFWDDPYISTQLLNAHLNDETLAASRPGIELDRMVRNLTDHGLADPGVRLLDLGCGPGLVAQRLAAGGAIVTGVDLSEGSLAYARDRAADANLDIEYRQRNVLDLNDEARYDIVLQSYGELSTFSEADRAAIFAIAHRALVAGGQLVFDVSMPAQFSDLDLTREWRIESGGLWRPDAYLLLTERFSFEGGLHCRQYQVIDDQGVTAYRMWYQTWDAAALTAELERSGFAVTHVWGSLAGDPYSNAGEWLAVVARRV
jgi:SAM-dependent methyltransferase